MFQPMPARWLAVSSALLALTVSAQTETAPAQARATAGPYRSALEGYPPYSEIKTVPWKEANDTVGRIGGWRAYAKEAAEGQAQGGQVAPAAGTKPAASQAKP